MITRGELLKLIIRLAAPSDKMSSPSDKIWIGNLPFGIPLMKVLRAFHVRGFLGVDNGFVKNPRSGFASGESAQGVFSCNDVQGAAQALGMDGVVVEEWWGDTEPRPLIVRFRVGRM